MRCSTISTIINLIGQVLFLCVHISGIFTTLEEASYYRHQPFSHFKTIKLINLRAKSDGAEAKLLQIQRQSGDQRGLQTQG